MITNEQIARKISENKFSYKNSFSFQSPHLRPSSMGVTEFFFKLPNDQWLIVWMRTQDINAFLAEPESKEVTIFSNDFVEQTPAGMVTTSMWGTNRAKACRKSIEDAFKIHYGL